MGSASPNPSPSPSTSPSPNPHPSPTLTRTRTLTRWIADLSWRVEEGERKIAAKFEPGVKGGTQPAGGLMDPPAAHQGTLTLTVVLALALTLTLNLGGRLELPIKARKQSDETEAGVGVRAVEAARVLGMTVKYETTPKTRPGPQPFHRTLILILAHNPNRIPGTRPCRRRRT